MRLLRPQPHLRRRQLLLGLTHLLLPCWWREHVRILGTCSPTPLWIPRELDFRYRYDLNVVRTPLVRHLGFLLSLTPLSGLGRLLQLLKEEAAAGFRSLPVFISVPSDEFFQLSDLLAIHLLLSIIFILQL